MLFILTPCRVSFALCVLLAFLVDAENAKDVAIGEPPRPVTLFQPTGRLIE